MKKITQLFILFACTFAGFAQTRAYIDFGAPSNETSGNYNNVSTEIQNDPDLFIENLIDGNGVNTDIRLDVSVPFDRFNDDGTTNPGENIFNIFPTTSTTDSFFGAGDRFNGNPARPFGEITLSGLDANMFYTFTIFASRVNNAGTRETLYTVTGATVDTDVINVLENRSRVALIQNMKAAEDGTIKIRVEPGATTTGPRFYYIGAVEMIISEETLGIDTNAFNGSLAVYPNPISNSAQITFDLQEQSNLKIDIYDLSGRLVENIVNSDQPAGKFSKTWDRSANIAAGLYILKINANGKMSNSKLLLK